MRWFRSLLFSFGASLLLLGAAPQASTPTADEKPPTPVTLTVQGLPATEGREIFAGDEAGNAYILQLVEQRVFELDEVTGQARPHSLLVSDTPIRGAIRAAVGDEGKTWVFGFAPFSVRVFKNSEEVEVEPPGPIITGMTVTGGRPTLSLSTAIPDIGSDLGKDGVIPEIPPLVVRLNAKGEWEPWVERESMDRHGREVLEIGLLGYETRLAGDTQGRLLMARRYRYDVREYKKSGVLADRMVEGDFELARMPDEVADRLEKAGRHPDRSRRQPKSLIEAVAWSPEGDVMILATSDEGYVLDRWVPALQHHERLALEELKGQTRLQMVAGRTGLMFLPGTENPKLTFVPWDYLRDAKWQSLDEAPDDAAPAPTP